MQCKDESSTDVALVVACSLVVSAVGRSDDDPVVSYGTDHDIYRLGDHLAARLPRIGWATSQAAKEAQWLPKLAHLPLAVPVQLPWGVGGGLPVEWSVYEWLPGENAMARSTIWISSCRPCGVVTALRQIDTTDAHPRPPGSRGAPLAELERGGSSVDRATRGPHRRRCRPSTRGRSHATPRRGTARRSGCTASLLPGNLLVVDGRLSAVIDFGGLNVGDPSCDLQPAWNVFAGDSRARYRAQLQVDNASWLRGRGWALAQAVVVAAVLLGHQPRHDSPGLTRACAVSPTDCAEREIAHFAWPERLIADRRSAASCPDGREIAPLASRRRQSRSLRLDCEQGRRDSNPRPTVLETAALPTELRPWARRIVARPDLRSLLA